MTSDNSNYLMATLEDEIRRFETDRIAFLRFSPRLEPRFLHETGPQRSRALMVQGLFALLVYDFFLVGDFLVAPQHVLRAAIVRLGVFTPLVLLAAYLSRRRWADRLRESAASALCLLAAVSVLYLHHDVDAVVTVEAEMGITVILLVMNCLLRVDLMYAMAVSVLIAAMNLTWLLMDAAMTASQKMVAGGMLLWVMVLTLAANYAISRERRYAYLQQLRGRLQRNLLAEANAELLAISATDTLTGLPNRHSYDVRLSDLWDMTRQDGTPLSAVMVDVDHFKALNDTYGHPYGDRVLQRVASLLQQALRAENDFVARYGGEEFIVLLPNADSESAMKVAERIRTLVQVAGSPALQRDTYTAEVWATVSCGVATAWPQGRTEPSRLIADADEAMYRAKQEGRNRVCCGTAVHVPTKLTVFPGHR